MGMYFSDYLNAKRDAAVKEAVAAIKPHKPDFLAVRGMSGMAIGPIVAHLLNIPLVLVRKPEEHKYSHCGKMPLNGIDAVNSGNKTYIVLDDFISSGATVQSIVDSLKNHTCLGFFGYAADCRRTRLDSELVKVHIKGTLQCEPIKPIPRVVHILFNP